MAEFRKQLTINDTGYLRLPTGNSSQRTNPQLGSVRFNTDEGNLEFYKSNGTWQSLAIPFKARTIITTHYMAGGYKNSVAWSNVNRTFANSDTTINLGDGRIRAFNYNPGACSKDIGWIFGAGGGHAISSNYSSGFNMRSEIGYTHLNKWDFDDGNRFRFGAIFQEHYYAWVSGGGAGGNWEEFNLTAEVMNGTVGTAWTTGNTWAGSHETFGILWTGNTSEQRFNFATRQNFGRGYTTGVSNNHQQKSVQSKQLTGNSLWCGNEGSYSGGYNLRRTNMTSDTTSGTVSKPVGNCGEENYTMGQDHQYMLGQYNGLQNNISWRFNYGTESGFQGGSTMEPKGHAGSSSGHCWWRD